MTPNGHQNDFSAPRYGLHESLNSFILPKWRPYRDLRIYCVYVKLCMFLFFNLASVLRKSSCIILHLQIDAKRDSLGNVEINRLHWNQSDEQHEEEEEEV